MHLWKIKQTCYNYWKSMAFPRIPCIRSDMNWGERQSCGTVRIHETTVTNKERTIRPSPLRSCIRSCKLHRQQYTSELYRRFAKVQNYCKRQINSCLGVRGVRSPDILTTGRGQKWITLVPLQVRAYGWRSNIHNTQGTQASCSL